MKKIGVLGALPAEVALMQQNLANQTQKELGGCTFFEGTLGEKEIVLVCAGMGKVNAAAATQLLCTSFGCEGIVFSGIAGNMSSEIGIGDVVLGETIVYHDAQNDMIAQSYPNLETYHSDATMLAAAKAACEAKGVRFLVGTVATGDLFVGTSSMKQAIATKCNPDCVEMEGAAVAHISAKNDVPCVIIRAMSDNADEQAQETVAQIEFDVSAYCTTASQLCTKMLELL